MASNEAVLYEAASKIPLLSRDEELTLFRRIKEQDDLHARQRIVLSHLRLVMHMANGFVRSKKMHEDLVQEGSVGLISAIDRFDPALGFRFSTYASWWVREAFHRFVRGASTELHVPHNVYANQSQIRRASQELAVELGQEPSTKQIASLLGKTEEWVLKYSQAPKVSMLSLETPLSNVSNEVLGDALVEKGTLSPEDYMMARTELNAVQKRFEGRILKLERHCDSKPEHKRALAVRRLGIFKSFFGIGCRARTYVELAKTHGVSHQRIQQMVYVLLEKASSPGRFKSLKDNAFVDDLQKIRLLSELLGEVSTV